MISTHCFQTDITLFWATFYTESLALENWYSHFLLEAVILPTGISAACESSGPFYFKVKKKKN